MDRIAARVRVALLAATMLATGCGSADAPGAVESVGPTATPAPLSEKYLATLLGYRYGPLDQKITAPYLIALAAHKGQTNVVIDSVGRSIIYNGDPYDVSVLVFAIDPLHAGRSATQRELVEAIAGNKELTSFNLEGRSAQYFESGAQRSNFAWLQQTYFVIVTGEDETRMLRIAEALVRANSSEAHYTVNGLVTATDGTPVEDVTVILWFAETTCCTRVVPPVYTGSTGRYQLSVPEGTYRVEFYPYGLVGLGTTWWKGASDFETATDLVVSGRNAVAIDATMPVGVRVRGTVRTAGGGMANAHIDAFSDATGGWVAGIVAGDDGRYLLRLAPGRYRIVFNGPDDSRVEERWWRDGDRPSKSEVLVVGNKDVEGIDILLGSPGAY
jgi:hypothetical protein